MITPKAHLNGSSRLDLISQWTLVWQTAHGLLESSLRLPSTWRRCLDAIREDGLQTCAALTTDKPCEGYASQAKAFLHLNVLDAIEPEAGRHVYLMLKPIHEALRAAYPHERDYYVLPEGSYSQARAEHDARLALVAAMQAECLNSARA